MTKNLYIRRQGSNTTNLGMKLTKSKEVHKRGSVAAGGEGLHVSVTALPTGAELAVQGADR